MKLLGWMNRKSRQDSIEPLKKFTTGNSCFFFSVQPSFDKQLYHLEPSYTSAHSNQTKRECSRYSACLTSRKEEELYKEETALFHGFLTVGTLGSESSIAEATTPKFAISCQNVNEHETEVTETEFKLINNELEKFLEAEATDDVDFDSSKRSSFVSTITLSNYQIEGNDIEENKNMVTCPLQVYLFNSSIECLETGEEMKIEKGSLEKLIEDNYKTIGKHKKQKEEEPRFKGTCTMGFLKKILKKIHVSSRSTKASGDDHTTCTISTKRKLPKAFRLLNKRIYPERSIADKKMNKSHKYKDRTKHQETGVTILEKDHHKFPKMTILKEKVTTMSINNDSLHRSHSTGIGEHWIKTDADYLVLEL